VSTLEPIVIVGAGGHGRGILEILRAVAAVAGAACPVAGFLDDDPGVLAAKPGGLPVLGSMEEAPRLIRGGHRFLIGVGEPRIRRAVADRLASNGAVFAAAVHPSVIMYGEVSVAPGCVLGAGVVVAAATRLCDHVLLNLNATVGHDCLLDRFATVGPGANIGGNVTMGEGAFVGLNGTVLPGRSLGPASQLGAGSVLLENLEAGCIAFGVPARVVGRTEQR
jgi:sugar O-acyltransferase (sialic acid O-acetyltransferase NeuD family)